jgi:hypothetical protein
LEARLKKAEANRQVADLASAQRSSAATKKIEYSTRQLGSGLTLPLDRVETKDKELSFNLDSVEEMRKLM